MGYLNSIAKFTYDKVQCYKPNSIESAKGHLDLVRQGIRSTKKQCNSVTTDDLGTANKILVKIKCSSTLYGDSTGRYPIKSRKGNNKILIGYSEQGNYARGVDGTMRPAVDHLSSEQNNGTENTWRKAIRLLEYAATFPDATIVYYPSDMILMSNVDGSYLSELQARSRAAAFHYLGRINDPTFVNGPIECVSCIIPTVVTSAAETEYASLFIAGKSLLPLRYTLNDMNCIQPTTIMYSDNTTAKGIATNTCKQRRSKSIDMRYHWIRDRVQLKDFDIVWRAGTDNYIADYLTKIHPAAHVLKMRKYFVKHAEPTFSASPAKQKALSG